MFLMRYSLVLLLAFAALATAGVLPEDATDDEDYDSTEDDDVEEKDKVYGGRYAALGQFPFMVAIHRLIASNKFSICSGSILTKRWVLTAGHCVYERPKIFLLTFGIVDKEGLRSNGMMTGGVSMISLVAVIHPGFGQGLNDIALIQAPRPIPFGETIQPIRLAYQFYDLSREDTDANILGWGQEGRDQPGARRLSYGLVSLMPTRECRRYWLVNDDHICSYATASQDVCQGDSGGPLVIREDDDEPLQIGVVSFGGADCPNLRPAVYTRVSSYVEWISEYTGIYFSERNVHGANSTASDDVQRANSTATDDVHRANNTASDDVIQRDNSTASDDVIQRVNSTAGEDVIQSANSTASDDVIQRVNSTAGDDVIQRTNSTASDDTR